MLKKLSLMAILIASMPASADYLSFVYEETDNPANPKNGSYLYSSDDAYTFSFEDSGKDDIRITVFDTDSNAIVLLEGKNVYDNGNLAVGSYEFDRLKDDGLLNETLYGDGSFNLNIVSVSQDAIQFSFDTIYTDEELINGQGCIGTGCDSAPSAVPVPTAAWLFGSALMGLAGIHRKKKSFK